MYEYPKELIDYLIEQESEGNEIFTTRSEDSVLWIIPQCGLDNWITLVSWYEGSESFNLINIEGSGFLRLEKVMKECMGF